MILLQESIIDIIKSIIKLQWEIMKQSSYLENVFFIFAMISMLGFAIFFIYHGFRIAIGDEDCSF